LEGRLFTFTFALPLKKRVVFKSKNQKIFQKYLGVTAMTCTFALLLKKRGKTSQKIFESLETAASRIYCEKKVSKRIH
jgi:hypothetical protein